MYTISKAKRMAALREEVWLANIGLKEALKKVKTAAEKASIRARIKENTTHIMSTWDPLY